MALPFDRAAVRELLARWERGEEGWHETVAAAEAFLDRDFPDFAKSGADSVTLEAMRIVSRLHIDFATRADVPFLLRFLDTRPGDERRAWKELESFYAGCDWDARASTWPAGA